jgi:hypothetical protein
MAPSMSTYKAAHRAGRATSRRTSRRTSFGDASAIGAGGLLLAAGAAPVLSIPVHVFGLLPIAVTARWVVLPLALTAVLLMTGPTPYGGWARHGLVAGLLAVAAYDAVRLPMVALGRWPDFIPRLGGWVLGSDSSNVVVGYSWRYFGDGGGMGLAFFIACGFLATVRPALVRRHPLTLAFGYGVFVWSGLVGTIAFSTLGASMLFALTPASLALSLLGHLIYGAVLGICLRRATRAAPSTPMLVTTQPEGGAGSPRR